MSPVAPTHPLLEDDEQHEVGAPVPGSRRDIDWRQPLGVVSFAFAVLAFLVGWFQIANTDQEWEQLPYLASAGGLGVVALGVAVALFVSVEHTRDREAVAELVREIRSLKRKVEALEATGRTGS